MNREFIAEFFIPQLYHQRLDYVGGLASGRENVMTQRGFGQDLQERTLSDRRFFEETGEVKNGAFIDTVMRQAAMDKAVGDQDCVAGVHLDRFVVEPERESAAVDQDQFIFDMPVKGHLVAGMGPVDEVVFEREIERAARLVFLRNRAFDHAALLACSGNPERETSS